MKSLLVTLLLIVLISSQSFGIQDILNQQQATIPNCANIQNNQCVRCQNTYRL